MAEAEIMVALEAMKTSVMYLSSDLYEMSSFLRTQYIGQSFAVYGVALNECNEEYVRVHVGMNAMHDRCRYAEYDLSEVRNMLVLYCQQFAFAPTMVP
jgi:hypothetical protein